VDDRGVLNFPAAAAGDLAFNVSGVLETILGSYCLALTTPPQLEAPSRPSPWPAPTGLPRLLTWNLHDLFDTIDDPATEDDVPSAPAYQRALSKHAQALAALGGSAKIALVGVQEVENGRALQDLLARPELTPGYRFVMFDGPDQRGLDVALVYDPAQVQIISAVSHQACTALQDGLGPDGNGDPLNPIMTPTCDLNSSGLLNGSRLFSRPPLAVHVRLALPAAGRPVWQPLWIVVVHLKSHLEDTFQQPYTQARRAEQARLLSQLSAALQSQSPGEPLAVIGDFNDDPSAPALEALRQSGLLPLSAQLAPAQRYTYLYEGVSYMYDNSYVNTPAMLVWGVPQAVHFNADFPSDLEGQAGAPWRASDHDPLVVEIAALQSRMWLPLIITQP
jgi:predicted extracellular nuclease